MDPVVIVSGARTPIGSFQGVFSPLTAPQLGAVAAAEAAKRAKLDPAEIDEVLFGNVLQGGVGQAPARQAAKGAGFPDSVGATTINKVCGSGLKAAALGAVLIRAGEARIILAGGMESMTNAPYILPKARAGYRMGNGEIIDMMVHDGLWDCYCGFHMGVTGDMVAEKYHASREEQDDLAWRSYERARKAAKDGAFSDEIVPVTVRERKSETVVTIDEEPQRATTLEKLRSLKPVFSPEGTVTAGNASKISDGAAAVVLMTEAEASKRGLQPLGRIVGFAQHALEPQWLMIAPVQATQKLLDKVGWTLKDVDLLEHNEAFASATVAVVKELGFDFERTNVHGGAVAMGHPIGCSGARVLVTLLYALKRHGKRRGVATLCLGGGEAVAMAVERP